MDVIRKEEYEIDPNSSFNRLRTLQKNLKEENVLRENYSKSKDELLKKIDSHCYEYYKTKIAIHELYDMPINIKYVVAKNSQSELTQCYEPLYNLMLTFRNDNAMMLKLIEKSSINHYDSLSSLLCHFFYENILSAKQDSDELLLLIYLLIEKEIDNLEDISSSSSSESFLDKSKSFVAKMLNNLSRKNEIRNYLETILHKLIIDFENINNKTNESNSNINLDLHKIKDELIKDKKKDKKSKKVTNYKSFLTSKIKVSKVFNNLNQTLRVNTNKDSLSSFYDDNPQIIDFYIFSKKQKENVFTYNSIEQYFEENGLYDKDKLDSSLTDSEIVYNTSYSNDLTENEIKRILTNQTNEDIISFYNKQLETLHNVNDDNIFTTNSLINEINKDKELKDNAEKIILIYKYTFEKVKEYIDYILCSIIQHKSSIPYIIKCICVIIDRLICIKFPNANTLIRNAFIYNFFFDNLILHELSQPSFNGLIPELIVSDAKKRKIEAVTQVIKQIAKGSFFCGNVDKDKMYTMFNTYIIEILPFLFEICKQLKEVKLPNVIEELLITKEQQINNNNNIDISNISTVCNINSDYLKEHSDEFIHLQSMCFSLDEFYIIYDIIKSNEDFFIQDKKSFFGKTFKKLSFHEKKITTKINKDNEQSKKTFIYFTNIKYSDKLKDTLFVQKSQKFSFQSGSEDMKENANELFIFERVKYSINTIVKHLNTLTRANFSADSESMENFVKGLNTMIELEGFSEMLKEKTIPLDWFGLYLQSNIGRIPQSKSRANYYQLYSDLIDDSKANYNVIKSDDTLNYVNSKTKISEKNIEIQSNMLMNYQQMIRRFQGTKFFLLCKEDYHICLQIKYKNGMPFKLSIIASEEPCKTSSGFFERKQTKHVHMNNINKLFEEFPDLTKETTETDILHYQSTSGFPASFDSFFESLKTIIQKRITMKYESKESFATLFIEIQNIIFRKLHYKLYPEMASENDLLLYRNCFKFSWIKPQQLHKDLCWVNDEMISLASEYIKNLNNEISPYDKIKSFAKVYEIVNSTLKLFDIKDENAFEMLLLYIFIQAQLMSIESNYIYIYLYLTKEQRNAYYEKVLAVFGKTKMMIENLSKESLIDVSDEEYETNIQKVYSVQS